ncbi:Uncharacterized protein TCAP_06227 [Tolypocladium capitatum]|uniref:Citrate transporter-like domain-containing protein n=1 Tax=Tolypocladium capitatum TaxID=45235 RepID=A0A2K3Q8F1_9HYPO|nr:Uncharacterized protein TCAP_06227 [Tolypocladium capitatum]
MPSTQFHPPRNGTSSVTASSIATAKNAFWKEYYQAKNPFYNNIVFAVFILANIIAAVPFRFPILIPRKLSNAFLIVLRALRVMPPKRDDDDDNNGNGNGNVESSWVRLNLPMNIVTAPLGANILLLAVRAIDKQDVLLGIFGDMHVSVPIRPFDIVALFISLAYITMSIDASGLTRYLAFKVLQWGGKAGHRLFFLLYAFFFVLGGIFGNNIVILSGTSFLAYMTRVSSNIVHPRAWIYAQFAVANIASAIFVTSSPANLILAAAFGIKFIDYTANMVVPVIATATVLFPFLLYIIFADESLIPRSIEMHELPDEARARRLVNPNIPHARDHVDEHEHELANDEHDRLRRLEETMNPFVDKGGAVFGVVTMVAALSAILAFGNLTYAHGVSNPVSLVTLPIAFTMFSRDLVFGWYHRKETRQIAQRARQDAAPTSRLDRGPATLVSLAKDAFVWLQETFPTATAAVVNLPFALVPYSFSMFILVDALRNYKWLALFSSAWSKWSDMTGIVGSMGGMGFLSVVLCNCAGTNIGATILLGKVIAFWDPAQPLHDRTFWGTVYSLALGVNYGAFSTAFSASQAGLLWRDILAQKHIRVGRLDFARENLPIISTAMFVGVTVLLGQMYLTKDNLVEATLMEPQEQPALAAL